MINTNIVSYYNYIAIHQGLLSKPPAPSASSDQPALPTETPAATAPTAPPTVPLPQSSPTLLADEVPTNLPTPAKDKIDNDSDHKHDDDHDHDGAPSAVITGTLLVNNTKETSLQSAFSITTQEGDQVNLSFNRTSSNTQTLVSSDGGYVFASSNSNSFAFDISVDGDINDDEKKAIMSIVKKISKIAAKFYHYDTQAALHKMDELHLNNEQLSQFSFNIKRTSTQSALISYQNVASSTDTADSSSAMNDIAPTNPVATTAALVEDINSTVDDMEKNVSTLSPHQTLVGIFNAITQLGQFQPQHPHDKVMDFVDFLKKLFHTSNELTDFGKKTPEKNSQEVAVVSAA